MGVTDRPNGRRERDGDVMNTRLGNILYGAGLVGAALGLIYAIDAVWVHESGQSLLPIDGRFVSREDMLIALGIGILLALISWGAGVAARHFVNRSAQNRTAANVARAAVPVRPVSGAHSGSARN